MPGRASHQIKVVAGHFSSQTTYDLCDTCMGRFRDGFEKEVAHWTRS